MEFLRSLAGIRVRLLANHPEMSKIDVAQLIPLSGYRHSENVETPKSRFSGPLFRGAETLSAAVEIDDSALQPDGNGVRAVVGAKLGEDIFDVAFYGFFCNGELRGDLFIGISA